MGLIPLLNPITSNLITVLSWLK